ncbi:MAG: helix-turn-helix domain-containing protein [Lachnospiraceae bacterium]
MPKSSKAPTHGPEYEEFGRNLAAARVALGLSQSDIAKSLGMTQSTYAGYETGTRKVPLSVIIQLANYFGKSPDELINGKSSDVHRIINDFPLSDLEKDIIKKFRTLTNGERSMFLRSIGLDDVPMESGNKKLTAG